jgi:hypothetical protein
MAFVKSPQIILEKAKQLQTVYYTVFDTDGKTVLDEQNEDLEHSEAYDQLCASMEAFEGLVTVVLRQNSKKAISRGGAIQANHVYKVRLGAATAGNGIGNMNDAMNLLTKVFEKEKEIMELRFKQEREIEQMNRKLEETKSVGPYDDLLKQYLPTITQFFLTKMGTNAPLATTPGIAGTETEAAETQAAHNAKMIEYLNTSIKRLLAVDGNFPKHLEMLADFAESKPDKYKQFVPMLNML